MNHLSNYKGKNVLITGGAGCIGCNLTKAFIKAEAAKIIVLDDLSSSAKWNIPVDTRVEFIQGSVLNDKILKDIFFHDLDYVFHLAAHFANQNSVDDPEKDLIVNGMGTLKVLEHAQHSRIKRFVYSSSGCGVYGLESKMPFEEHDVSISLHTPYQVTKLLGELYTNYFHNLYGLPIVNARFFNVFGPGEVPGRYRNVIPNFMYWAMHGQSLPITGDGTETRDWTYVEDIVSGLITMGIEEKAIGQAINLGSGTEHKVIDMANLVNEITGNKSGVKFTQRRDWDVKTRLLSSIDKAGNILGYKPTVKFEDGVSKIYGWFTENWDNIKVSAEF
ncbi:NAD-dependent epimerase/dehydratase family protein [Chloroflexota bacterium]